MDDQDLIAECQRRGWSVEIDCQITVPAVEAKPISQLSVGEFQDYVRKRFGVRLGVGPHSFRLLDVLLRTYPRRASIDLMLQAIYNGQEPDGALSSMRAMISTLRRKLTGTPFTIDNELAIGYRLVIRDELL